jgi:NAD(P)-dependent dehydrogenase (short-subunit alcohol dehydrogenase family)
MDSFSLSGKTALVAGASRGIGLAIAQAVARAGADTLLAARSIDRLNEEATKLRDSGLKARALRLDTCDRQSVSDAAQAAGAVDILINVSGANIRKRFPEFTREEYSRIMETNLHGIFELTQKVGAGMVTRGGGKIVMIGSLMSILGLPYVTVYATTKAALAGLTRSLAAEWGRYNIQVNCIAPGFILTDLNRDMWQPPVMVNWLKGVQAMPRMGSPADVAPLAVFLSGKGSDYITGQVIAVDGGYSTTGVWPFEP